MIRVLIADDQKINRRLLAGSLDKQRYEVIEAENGQEALNIFEKDNLDVVLLDVMMPVMDGFEAAKAMKARLGNDHVPIIMVTALNDEKNMARGMEAGADDFVPKPFNKMVLESKMTAALRTRQLFRSLKEQKEQLQVLRDQSHREQVMAEKLMAGVLRSKALHLPMFKFRSRPMDVFNGDILMATQAKKNGKMRIMLGDFAGHGLAAAIGGLPLANAFEELTQSGCGLYEIAQIANDRLRAVLPRDRFLAACIVDLDVEEGECSILNAGLPPVVIRAVNGGTRTIIPSGFLPLGILGQIEGPEGIVHLRLQQGDRLYLYSDGVTEAEDTSGNAFGEQHLHTLISDLDNDERVFEEIIHQLDTFTKDATVGDDVTFLEICVDKTKVGDFLPDVSIKGHPRFSLRATPDLIRSSDPMLIIQKLLENIASLDGHRTELYAIIAELFNNALEHGVLGLDSSMKQGVEGFLKYYETRSEAIEILSRGYIDIDLTFVSQPTHEQIRIVIEDSGSGFDVSKMNEPEPENSEQMSYGRGIKLVKDLCRSVRYFEPGNRVEAIYQWQSPTKESERDSSAN